jgi:hypothetical protein
MAADYPQTTWYLGAQQDPEVCPPAGDVEMSTLDQQPAFYQAESEDEEHNGY